MDAAEGKNGVEMIARDGSISLVRERAFATPADKRRFVDYARASLLD